MKQSSFFTLAMRKDGIQTTYASDERRVSIVRSKVSGVSVVAYGTNPAGAWSLGTNERFT